MGTLFGCVEALLVALTHWELFLSVREFARFTLIASSVSVSLALMLVCLFGGTHAVLRRLAPQRLSLAVALVSGAIASPFAAWLFWELTDGRRVRDLSFRPAAVCIATLLTAAVTMAFAVGMLNLSHARLRDRRMGFVLLMLVAAAWLATDVFVLHRLYPPFHRALDVLALISCAAAVAVWPFAPPSERWLSRSLSAVALLTGLGAPFLLKEVLRAPNLHYAIAQAAPLTG
ncbi:MAG TPA: hypothetical protein VHZ95_15235, partial [Polyangiales bacterium]|nr:hypothetical protein [Polyangiales bacterium]